MTLRPPYIFFTPFLVQNSFSQCETLPDKTMQIREASLNPIEMPPSPLPPLLLARGLRQSLYGY